jgi:ribose 5-phosphate isomerase B
MTEDAKRRVAIAADHNGVALKAELAEWLVAHGYQVDDRGTNSDEVVDYPPLCVDVGRLVQSGEVDFGVILGGSGQGEQIACNKMRGVRAATCHSLLATEIARGHNDANVLVLGTKMVTTAEAREILSVWVTTPFKGGRHRKRLEQIEAIERGELELP